MTGWMIETLIASSLLMLAVLALRGAAARAFGPRLAYALWVLPALRMLLPPLPEAIVPAPLTSLLPATPALAPVEMGTAAASLASTAPVASSPISGIDWLAVLPPLLLAVWLLGATAHFAVGLGRYRRFLGAALAEATPLFREGSIVVSLSGAVEGPVAVGLMRRHILLPRDFDTRYGGDCGRLALEHELAHHRRGDLFANLAGLAMLSLHWFNPIAHRAYRAFRIDQELACDATVLRRASAAQRHAYGAALVRSAIGGAPGVVCALGNADQLKGRLRMMARRGPGAFGRASGMGFAVLMLAGGLVLTASASPAEEVMAVHVTEDSVAAVPATPAVPPLPPVPPAGAHRRELWVQDGKVIRSTDIRPSSVAPVAAPARVASPASPARVASTDRAVPAPPAPPAPPSPPAFDGSTPPTPPLPPVPPSPPSVGEARRAAADARANAAEWRAWASEARRHAQEQAREQAELGREQAREARRAAAEARREAEAARREAGRERELARLDAEALRRDIERDVRDALDREGL